MYSWSQSIKIHSRISGKANEVCFLQIVHDHSFWQAINNFFLSSFQLKISFTRLLHSEKSIFYVNFTSQAKVTQTIKETETERVDFDQYQEILGRPLNANNK